MRCLHVDQLTLIRSRVRPCSASIRSTDFTSTTNQVLSRAKRKIVAYSVFILVSGISDLILRTGLFLQRFGLLTNSIFSSSLCLDAMHIPLLAAHIKKASLAMKSPGNGKIDSGGVGDQVAAWLGIGKLRMVNQ